MKGILAIYDEEADYANRLMEYINRKYKNTIQVRVFTNPDSFKEFLGQAPIHILLLNENLSVEEMKHDSIQHICLLCEGKIHSENNSYPMIYKYQSAETILKELFCHFPVFKPKERDGVIPDHKKIISVFSLGEDTLRQLFSYSLAKQYSVKKQTLYINFNGLIILNELSGFKVKKDLSEVIYYLKQNNPNLENKIRENIIRKDTLDCMEGVSFGPDLYELTAEEMDKWLKVILNTDYEVIIMDMGSYYQASLELLHQSSQILWPAERNHWELLKFNHFCGQMDWSGNGEIMNKITFVGISDEEKQQLLKVSEGDFDLTVLNWSLPTDYIKDECL